ncbi:multiple sugar transport system substrate-binding protein [Paenibacillus castaneae]|uniref:ABC transporter substrate-binding protein n=1 Tax=Paenibacillus castaneae TaxID=474957 RepID=UPI000C99B621|nr:extracellular solute-binding protein [Paenibacillus castaneae]NIK78034.1 multiple sugar transport system substrate-binding protein [Paenibacillus castaneae]
MLISQGAKRLSLLITIMMLLGLLAACGGGNSSNKTVDTGKNNKGAVDDTKADQTIKGNEDYKGEFVLWTWEPEHDTALAAFNAKYPNIKLKRVNVAAEDISKKLQTTIASGGELPDVVRIESGQKAKIFDMDILENLEDGPYHADKSILFDYDSASFSKDGHMISIPDDMSVAGIAYIKPLAKQYFGTDNPEEMEAMFTDWDVFIEKGKEVLQQSGGKVRMFPSLGDVNQTLKGQRTEPYFDGEKLNVPMLTKTVTTLVKFRDSGIIDKLDQWTPAWNAAFGGDKYIFAICPVWMPQYVIGPNDKKDDRWALMVPPNGGFIRGGSSHGIPKGAKNGELAWKWIEFVSMSQEGAEAQKTDGVFTHFKKAYEDASFTKWTWRNFGTQDIGHKFFVNISESTTDMPENINDLVLDDAMNIVIQTLAKDNSFGVDQALDKIQKELKAKAPSIVWE